LKSLGLFLGSGFDLLIWAEYWVCSQEKTQAQESQKNAWAWTLGIGKKLDQGCPQLKKNFPRRSFNFPKNVQKTRNFTQSAVADGPGPALLLVRSPVSLVF